MQKGSVLYGKAQFVIYLLYRNSGRSRMFYYNFFLASDSAFCNCFCCIGYIVLLCASASCRLCTSCHNYYYYIRLYWWGATISVNVLTRRRSISIHAPRVRCDPHPPETGREQSHFNPRTSCEVRHSNDTTWGDNLSISIHAPRVRCDDISPKRWYSIYNFNPRTSCEVRLHGRYLPIIHLLFQSTHLVWGATYTSFCPETGRQISIHAPRVRCDLLLPLPILIFVFQSTHLVWGATLLQRRYFNISYISIHAPRVRCDVIVRVREARRWISIHAPRVRCDSAYLPKEADFIIFQSTHLVWGATAISGGYSNINRFQSTHLVWGATIESEDNLSHDGISIHAPRVRCDNNFIHASAGAVNFNPRTSCEVRPPMSEKVTVTDNFNPRTSCEVRRWKHWYLRCLPYFNPRTSCEVRLQWFATMQRFSNFNPRTSCEVRHGFTDINAQWKVISIHAPRVRCDNPWPVSAFWIYYFNPRTSCEVRQRNMKSLKTHEKFQSTHLVWGATLWSLTNVGCF